MAEKEEKQENKQTKKNAIREIRNVEEHDERVIQIDRVTRVVKGGRRLRFRATVVVGDRNGRVGVGVAKGAAVVLAIQKAIAKAKKNMAEVNLYGSTIPHEVNSVYCGAKVFLKPASPGTGVIAGGAVRAVVEAAGVKDILSKMLGSTNKINNVYATFQALESLQKKEIPTKKKEAKEAKKAEALMSRGGGVPAKNVGKEKTAEKKAVESKSYAKKIVTKKKVEKNGTK